MSEESKGIAVIDESAIKDKIYTIRGVQVMLDYDLAEIYGYSTSAFNQQVKRNSEKFDSDFRFQLSTDEIHSVSVSQKVIPIQTKGKRGGRSKPVNAFSESGIYMLMTVLKGELAIKQSNIFFSDDFHDRFLILDNRDLFHIGASIKDAGRKAFEISITEDKMILDAIMTHLSGISQ